MECQNEIIDITEDYRIDVPFLSLLSEELSQKNLSRINNVVKSILSIINSGVNMMHIGENWIQDLQGGIISGITGKIGGVSSASKNMASTKYSAMEEGLSIIKSWWDIKVANSPIFSSTEGKFTNSLNFVNSLIGIAVFTVDSVNDNFVKEIINNYGYVVYNIINDINKLQLYNPDYFVSKNCNYNTVKFEKINLYGSFTREIALVLASIFESGVKIWYDYQMREDNYVI